MKRFSIKEILKDPIKRKELFVRFIISCQAMEGIITTRERAEEVYNIIQQEKKCRSKQH